MLSLIADGAPLKTETCPETLLFDVYRLSVLQAEYQYIVLAATMMVTAGHSLAATRNPIDAQVVNPQCTSCCRDYQLLTDHLP